MSSRWPSSVSTRRHFHRMTMLCRYCQAASFTCQTGLIMAARSKCSVLFLWLRLCTLTDAWQDLCPHRLVLSSVSDYFAAMFTSDVREAKQDEVKMEGVDPDALWVLVQYAYTGTEKYWPLFIETSICIFAGTQTQEKCMFVYSDSSFLYSRPPGVKRGHHWVSAVGVVPAPVVLCGSGMLFFPDETAPPL